MCSYSVITAVAEILCLRFFIANPIFSRYTFGMGSIDITEKTLLSYNDVFADVINVLLCNGERIVNENDLTDAQTFSQYKASDGGIKEQDRDVSKFWNGQEVHLSMFGFENQTVQDDAMPLRVIGYDGAAYREQVHNKKSEWYPVITLVLYFGTEKKWHKGKQLSEQIAVSPVLKPFFHDYGINVFDMAWLSDEQINAFQSDFRLVAQYLKALRTGKVENWSPQKLTHIHEILNLFQVISDEEISAEMENFVYETQKKGGTAMTGIFKQARIDGRNEGISIGRSEGISSMTSLMSSLYAQGRDADVKRAMTDSAYLQELLAAYEQQTQG